MSNNQAFSNSQASLDQGSQLATLIAQVGSNRKPLPRHNNEVENYLESGTTSIDPCSFWKGHQHEFPMLASVARDVLSIPATGAGVERLFNSARDICHYRRGSLKPTTIRDLVMYMCATKFDLGEEELETFRQSFSREERETADEEKDAQHPQESLDPISDDEEDPRIESREVEINAYVATGLNSGREQLDLLQGSSSEGEEVLGITRGSGDDDDGEHPLPRDHSLKRSSGRDVQVGGRGPLGPPTGHQKVSKPAHGPVWTCPSMGQLDFGEV
ncbi:hypothetical protein N7471_010418 [Penicillium samsonianum]|uniref:uncharacterized protein n=1 Tax=Penicillium samsonianum TaxID=1882272 RepID=UPI002548FC09|nr:uncharacterized protein N7471_010418 [Penicillium samsonianum]KAJ6125925.1 hypothetical protein N7471_010418 [Penicillium samsonianum]